MNLLFVQVYAIYQIVMYVQQRHRKFQISGQ